METDVFGYALVVVHATIGSVHLVDGTEGIMFFCLYVCVYVCASIMHASVCGCARVCLGGNIPDLLAISL